MRGPSVSTLGRRVSTPSGKCPDGGSADRRGARGGGKPLRLRRCRCPARGAAAAGDNAKGQPSRAAVRGSPGGPCCRNGPHCGRTGERFRWAWRDARGPGRTVLAARPDRQARELVRRSRRTTQLHLAARLRHCPHPPCRRPGGMGPGLACTCAARTDRSRAVQPDRRARGASAAAHPPYACPDAAGRGAGRAGRGRTGRDGLYVRQGFHRGPCGLRRALRPGGTDLGRGACRAGTWWRKEMERRSTG